MKKSLFIYLLLIGVLFYSIAAFGDLLNVKANVKATDYLPDINEVYNQAKSFRIIGNWKDRIPLTSKAYSTMSETKRAIEVGKTLADVSFYVFNRDDSKIPDNALEIARSAIDSLSPPEKIARKINALESDIQRLSGEKLRKRINDLIKDAISELQKNPKYKDVGTLVLASSFCRSMYFGVSTVAQMKNPTPPQLAMFRYGGMINYIIDYFKAGNESRASKKYQDDTRVKNLVINLTNIRPLIEKQPDKITITDIRMVSQILEQGYK